VRTHTTEGEEIAYRNFNLCPHCEAQGEPATLCRMRESLPMISRSDGETFHLVLADRPRPYPNERSAGTTHEVSVCFWYSHLNDADETHSTIVILPASDSNCPTLFRTIETVADLLAAELGRHRQLAEFYEFFQSSVDPEDRRPS
jgi:hypothetical protein